MSSPKLVMPKVGSHLILTTPARHVLQMTLNRPKQLNAMTDAMEEDICRVFEWFETEPSLWVIILAGKGRAFCAGQDLKDWLSKNQTSETVRHASGEPMQSDAEVNKSIQRLKRGGFGGMSTRRSAKPIIAAVDGICMGGGTETILNCDMVVASTRSVIGLPEVARGVVAAMGGIPRLTQLCGHQRASELLLLGKPISAKEAHDRYNMVNRLVDVAKSTSDELGQAAVDQAAIEIAIQLTQNSPDSVLVTKSALVMARDATDGDIDASARDNMLSDRSRLLYVGKNINEGLEAFKGKRNPKWFNPVPLAAVVSDPRSKL
ncbi:related to enoyl-CoA hydratase [Ustilago trichophora]|uniref:Related to enoyl-CoA hydratase n=1 Tax=Ustilago trichophora TaxID=86804 RepID=A0A5C3E9X0_9BASI|nr:related to enoyl-CoA hydratase [Ustilago trichophora]